MKNLHWKEGELQKLKVKLFNDRSILLEQRETVEKIRTEYLAASSYIEEKKIKVRFGDASKQLKSTEMSIAKIEKAIKDLNTNFPTPKAA